MTEPSHTKYTSRIDAIRTELSTATRLYLHEIQQIHSNGDLSADGKQKRVDERRKKYESEIKELEGRAQTITDKWRQAVGATKTKEAVSDSALETLKAELGSIGPDQTPLNVVLDLLVRDKSIAVALSDQDGKAEVERALRRAGAEQSEVQQMSRLVSQAAERAVSNADPDRNERGKEESLIRHHETSVMHAVEGIRQGLERGGEVIIASPTDETTENFTFAQGG